MPLAEDKTGLFCTFIERNGIFIENNRICSILVIFFATCCRMNAPDYPDRSTTSETKINFGKRISKWEKTMAEYQGKPLGNRRFGFGIAVGTDMT